MKYKGFKIKKEVIPRNSHKRKIKTVASTYSMPFKVICNGAGGYNYIRFDTKSGAKRFIDSLGESNG
tara:strand:+ start:382 stop:582 length:201 start_codon:yes stop_codon:yes gene_type:complete